MLMLTTMEIAPPGREIISFHLRIHLNLNRMKNLLSFLILISAAVSASAQKVYFIYLQSDNSSAFYVKMQDKIYSSSALGYVILSNLVDSAYSFSIGFSSSQSESKFTVKLEAKDRGFLIKTVDSGLALFDLQSLTIIPEQKDDSPKNISYIRRNDDFSSLLARAAKDTSLLYAVVRVKEDELAIKTEPKEQVVTQTTIEPASLKDTVASNLSQIDNTLAEKELDTIETTQPGSGTNNSEEIASAPIKDEPKKDTVAFAGAIEPPQNSISVTISDSDTLANNSHLPNTTTLAEEQVFKKSQVKKYSESSTSEGFGLIYYDIHDGGRDTIRLLIPNPPIVFKSGEPDSSLVQKDFIRVDELKRDTVKQAPIVVAVKKNESTKSQCKAIASGKDFFKLRKNMASETTDEGMVNEAKKMFKNKCFNTEQIKNLSTLFLTSAGKYQFFDAAYLHVSDQEKFSSLESEIKDDYYLKRFKALIGE